MALSQLKIKLGALVLLLVLATAVIALIAATRLQSLAASMSTVFDDRVICLQQLHTVEDAYGRRIPAAIAKFRNGTLGSAQAVSELVAARKRADLEWGAYLHTYLTPKEAQLVVVAGAALAKADKAAAQVQKLLQSNDRSGVEKFAAQELPQSVDPLVNAIDDLLVLQVDVSREENARSHTSYQQTVGLLALLSGGAVALGALLTWQVLRRYARETAEYEDRLTRRNSFYAALSQTNQLLVKERDEASLLSEICTIAVETGHADFACIHVLEDGWVRRVATAGQPQAFFDNFPEVGSITAEDTQHTLVSQALRECEVVVRQDYDSEVPSNRWERVMLNYGVRSAASFPIGRGGNFFGTLSLYAHEEHFFEDSLVKLVSEMAADISFALDNIDRREKLTEAASAKAAQLSAELANQAKTTFLSKMSHELRTPLNAMLGFTQLIQHDARDRLVPSDFERLDHIRQAGWHLLSLVNDVLDVSRIESGRFDMHVRSLLLAPMLEDALQISDQLAKQSGITMGAAFRNMEAVHALADPVRLRQVLINLLSNAIKYNRPGGSVFVQIEVRPEAVMVQVIDTGLGMSAEQLEHLYEPFNRLGRERGGIDGTGLGLALTRQLVGLMGGELDFDSKIGRGTTASVTLMRAEAPADIATAPTAGDGTGNSADKSVHGLVLYVEDNEVNVMLVEQMLSCWPEVRFVHAPDGQTGVLMAKSLKPDLILLDMNMPDMSGLQVLERLQQDPATRPLRVIVLSASAMSDDIAQASAAGALDYWTKPLDFARFLDGVARRLSTTIQHQTALNEAQS